MDDDLAKVTKGQLTLADRRCARRLQCEYGNQRGNRQPDVRYRVSNQIEHDVRLAHVDCVRPDPQRFRATDDLREEQRAEYDLFAQWYLTLFGAEAVRMVAEPGDDWVTPWPELGARLVGKQALRCEHADGRVELRLLEFDERPTPGRLLDAPAVRFALLRARGACNGEVSIGVGNLRTGQRAEQPVVFEDAFAEAEAWLHDRVEIIRARIANPEPVPGLECGSCAYIAGCGAHR
jgi:hypothetical protein